MTIDVSLRAPEQSPDEIPDVPAADRPDSLTHRRTVAGTGARRRGRPLRERPPHARAHRS